MGATLPQTLIFFHLGSGFAVTAIRWQTEARCGDQLDHIVRFFLFGFALSTLFPHLARETLSFCDLLQKAAALPIAVGVVLATR
jgi:hypothetical protein